MAKPNNKQIILVTGATGNVGGAAAIALAKRGARVVLFGRKLETLEARVDSIRAALSEARIECQDTDIATLVVDFSDMESVKLAAADAMNEFPKIHGLILSAVLLDPTWNPFIKHISGSTKPGEILSVKIQPKNKKLMKFTPKVLKNEREKEFRWLGHLFVKGLFDGEHYFQLEAISSNKTRFIHGENFSGIMSGLLLKMIGDSILEGFQAMNEALEETAEAAV